MSEPGQPDCTVTILTRCSTAKPSAYFQRTGALLGVRWGCRGQKCFIAVLFCVSFLLGFFDASGYIVIISNNYKSNCVSSWVTVPSFQATWGVKKMNSLIRRVVLGGAAARQQEGFHSLLAFSSFVSKYVAEFLLYSYMLLVGM